MEQLRRHRIIVEIPRRRPIDIDTEEVHMSKLRHSWLPNHLKVLCLLYRCYDNSPPEYAGIFNHIFRDDLLAEGFKTGLNHERLVSRWNSVKDWDGGHDVWKRINLKLSQREARTRYRHLLDDIEEAALELEIPLTLRIQQHHGAVQHSRHLGQKARRVKEIRGVLGESMLTAEEAGSDIEPPRRLRRVRSAEDTPRGLGVKQPGVSVPISLSAPAGGGSPNLVRKLSWSTRAGGHAISLVRKFDKTGAKARRMPCLVYRWHSDLSNGRNGPQGFRAGLFQDRTRAIPPPPIGAELNALAQQHLTLESTEHRPSPFISFFDSMLPALQRALHSADNAQLTIVDLREVEESLQERFPDSEEVIFLVFQFVKAGMRMEGNYSGNSEWLVWGVVEQSAVVASFKISDLLRTPEFNSVLQLDTIQRASSMLELHRNWPEPGTRMNYESGETVGRFLQFIGVPDHCKELVAAKLANTWKFDGFRRAKETRRYEKYMNGVFNICGSIRANSIGLEDGDEEEGEDVPSNFDDSENHTISLDDAEPAERIEAVTGATMASSFIESSDDEEDLVDRQLEADCPWLCANHRQTIEDDNLEATMNCSGNAWDSGPRREYLYTTRASSLDTFAKELFEAAETCNPAPQIAHTGEWEGSPWRSVTPFLRHSAVRTITASDGQMTHVIDLSMDTDEEESADEDKRRHEINAKKLAAAKVMPISGARGNVNGVGIFTKRG